MRVSLCTTVLAACLTVPVWAHHSVSATFDRTSSVTVSGVVARVEWRNPHAVIHLRLKTSGGETVRHIELAGPASVARRGLRQGDIGVGDVVTFQALLPIPGHDNADWLSATTLTLADGRRFDVHDNFGEGIFK